MNQYGSGCWDHSISGETFLIIKWVACGEWSENSFLCICGSS